MYTNVPVGAALALELKCLESSAKFQHNITQRYICQKHSSSFTCNYYRGKWEKKI